MNVTSKLLRASAAAFAAVTLFAGPVAAVEEDPAVDPNGATEETLGEHGGADAGKYQIAETPRQQLGLVILGALGVGAWLAGSNMRRQMRGERPQATGEFRWR